MPPLFHFPISVFAGTRLPCAILLVAACIMAAPAQAVPEDDSCRTFTVGAGSRPKLSISNGHGHLDLTFEGSRVTARLNNRPIPDSRVVRKDSVLRILGDSGDTLFALGLLSGSGSHRQFFYLPEFDPASGLFRLGLRIEKVNDALAAQLNLLPFEAMLVSKICDPKGPTASVLRKYDVIARINGDTPASEHALEAAVQRARLGDTLRLRIFREAKPLDVTIRIPSASGWPDDARLESEFRAAQRELENLGKKIGSAQ